MANVTDTNTIIIGAGAGGLACAACLKRQGIPFILLEQNDKIGNEWTQRYDRLHLHTPRNHSGLPYFKIPADLPKYVSKDEFAHYLNQYADAFQINPFFNQKVISVQREKNKWEILTDSNKFSSDNIIIATGYARKPIQPFYDRNTDFKGETIHSTKYKNGESYKNKKVLVVGFGNSACEVAICLHEHHAFPALSVRSEVNIIPRDIAGISITSIAIAEQWITKISARLTDFINTPILRLINGNVEKLGLKKLSYGPVEQIMKHKKIPLLDIGTLKLIREGKIKIYPGIHAFVPEGVEFTDGKKENFDVIIFATGYQPDLADFLKDYQGISDTIQWPPGSGPASSFQNLYFCGFNVTPTGMLREIGIEAKKIAKSLSKQSKR